MIRGFNGKVPKIHPTAFVHPAAEVIGMVEIKAGASVWPGCVLRGDTDRIVIGERSNIQDNSVIHCDAGIPTILGKGITVGHACILHGCRIADHVLVGMGSVILEADIGPWSFIGARALLLSGLKVPAKSLALGSPAKVIRPVSDKEIAAIRQGAKNYFERQHQHRKTSFVIA